MQQCFKNINRPVCSYEPVQKNKLDLLFCDSLSFLCFITSEREGKIIEHMVSYTEEGDEDREMWYNEKFFSILEVMEQVWSHSIIIPIPPDGRII